MRNGEIILVRDWGWHVSQISPPEICSLSEQLDADFRIVGYFKGLWCLHLSGNENCKFVIANPTTHELKYLPLLNVRSSCGESSCRSSRCSIWFDRDPFCALGFDSSNEELKILAIVRTSYYDDEVDLPKDFDNDSCHFTSHRKFIYSLKTNEWKECEEVACPWDWRDVTKMAITCNNVCYWALQPLDEPPSIGLFDFCDEEFSALPYPPDNYDKDFINFAVIDLLGSVCVVTYLRYAGTKFFRFWVRGDGDGDGGMWKRETDYDVLLYGVERPLGVTSHPLFGLSCWFVGLDERLVRYDYDIKKSETLYQFRDPCMTLFPRVLTNFNLDGVRGAFGRMFGNNVEMKSNDEDAGHKGALDFLAKGSKLI